METLDSHVRRLRAPRAHESDFRATGLLSFSKRAQRRAIKKEAPGFPGASFLVSDFQTFHPLFEFDAPADHVGGPMIAD